MTIRVLACFSSFDRLREEGNDAAVMWAGERKDKRGTE